MCERLLNLQEIYVSGQNICIEVYGNSVGTITPIRDARWEFLDLKRPLKNLCFVSSVIVFKTE